MSITALLYNWGFFTMLGYAPYPMELDAIQLGFVFFGWGLLVAFFAVIGAPRLQARFGTAPSLYGALGFFAVLLLLIGLFTDVRWALIACVIASGIVVGINNTLTTQAVMLVSPVERPVASASYGFVRFIGGGLAPFAAGKLAEHFGLHVPFLVGAVAVARRHRRALHRPPDARARPTPSWPRTGTPPAATRRSPARWPTSSAAPRARSTSELEAERAAAADPGSRRRRADLRWTT